MDSPVTIEIRGKTYAVREISLYRFQRILQAETVIAKAAMERDEDPFNDEKDQRYKTLWLKFLGLVLEGDLSALDVEGLTAEELGVLRSFFETTALETVKNLSGGAATSNGSAAEAQTTSLDQSTKSTI